MRIALVACLAATLLAHESRAEHYDAYQKGDQRDLPADRGAYVGPPRSGVEVGESRGVGVSGLGLHFPPLSIRLPTLTLPCLVKHRSRAHLLSGPDVAPYVEDVAREEYGVESRTREIESPRDREFPDQKSTFQKIGYGSENARSPWLTHDNLPQANEATHATTQDREAEYYEKLEQLNRQIEECQRLSDRLNDVLRDRSAMGRLPSAALSNSHGRPSRLPAVHNSVQFEILPASHWVATSSRHEPELLERLPRDQVQPVPYPVTSR